MHPRQLDYLLSLSNIPDLRVRDLVHLHPCSACAVRSAYIALLKAGYISSYFNADTHLVFNITQSGRDYVEHLIRVVGLYKPCN